MRGFVPFVDWSLRTKMVVMLLLTSFLPLASSAFFDIRNMRQQLISQTYSLLTARGEQLVRELDTFNHSYQRSVHFFSQLPDVINYSQTDGHSAAEEKVRILATMAVKTASDKYLRGIALIDMSGKVILASEQRLDGKNLAYLRHIQNALSGKEIISDIYLADSEDGYTPTIAFLAPVRDGKGKQFGALAYWILAAALWDVAQLSNGLAGSNSFAVMFDHFGIRIAHTYNKDIVFHPGGKLDSDTIDELVAERRFGQNTRQLLNDVKAFPEQFDRARSELPDDGAFHGWAPVNSQWNYGVGRRLHSVYWTVFYMIPEKSVQDQIKQLTLEKLALAILIIILALAGGIVLSRILLMPIHALDSATEALARGDLTMRIPTPHKDEIGRLSQSFNAMATALQRARDELEIRVEERTTDLRRMTNSLKVEVQERTNAESAMRESEQNLAITLNSIGDAVISTDIKGFIMRMNPVAENLTGWSIAEAIGKPLESVFSIINEETRDRAESPVIQVLRENAKVSLADRTILLAKDGTEHPIAESGAPIQDRNRGTLGVVLVFRDITVEREAERIRKQSEEKIKKLNESLERRILERTSDLEASNKELESFAYSVSHDLRSPLRGIDGFSQLLLERYADQIDERGKGYLARVRAASQRMGKLIDDILNLSRISRGEMKRDSVDLSSLARDIEMELRQRDPERQVEFIIFESLLVTGDSRLLRVALENLLNNAWKFTSKKATATIELGLAKSGDHAEYFVRDSGAGFSMEYSGKLFGVFQRLHETTEFPGTGIGLATVQRIIRRHGGMIRAEGEIDKGATFYFTL